MTEVAPRPLMCDGFIAKPCLPPDLVVEIGRYLKPQPDARDRRRQRRY